MRIRQLDKYGNEMNFVDISPEELARQLKEQGYCCFPIDNLKSDKQGLCSCDFSDTMTNFANGRCIKCGLIKPQSQECSCKPDKHGELPATPEGLCGKCGKPIPELKKESWNDGEDTHCTVYMRDGSVFHKGEGKARDCKVCNPPKKIEKLHGALGITENKVNEIIDQLNGKG